MFLYSEKKKHRHVSASARKCSWRHLAGMEWGHAERKRSSCLHKEVGDIFQGTPESDLDLLTAAKRGSLVYFFTRFQASILLFPVLLWYFPESALGTGYLNYPGLAENDGICPQSENPEE